MVQECGIHEQGSATCATGGRAVVGDVPCEKNWCCKWVKMTDETKSLFTALIVLYRLNTYMNETYNNTQKQVKRNTDKKMNAK